MCACTVLSVASSDKVPHVYVFMTVTQDSGTVSGRLLPVSSSQC